MSVNNVGGPLDGKKPEQGKTANPDKFKQEMRVKKTEGIDPDQKKRRRQRALGSSQEPSPQKKSIYDTNFSARSYGCPQPSQVPSPAPELSDNRSLPHSHSFWQNQRPIQREKKETSSNKSPSEKNPLKKTSSSDHVDEKKTSHKKNMSGLKKKSPSSFEGKIDLPFDNRKGAKDFPTEDKEPFTKDLDKDPFSQKLSKGKEKPSFSPEFDASDEERSPSTKQAKKTKEPSFEDPNQDAFSLKKPREKLSEKKKLPEKKPRHLENIAATFSPIEPVGDQKSFDQDQGQSGSISVDQIPITGSSISTAFEAVTKAHLPPQIDTLFTQMVGAMVQMSEKGISRTEVFLNSAAFQNSPFFGASIVLEKYATAPDSFNIQLLGSSHEQMKAFSSAVQTLQTTFLEAPFAFRVGRIETYYDPDRPLFRRKESAGDGDRDSSGGDR